MNCRHMCRDTEVNGRGWEGKHFQHRLQKRKTEGVKKSHGPSRAVKTARELQNYRLSGNIVSLQDQPELVSAYSAVVISQIRL